MNKLLAVLCVCLTACTFDESTESTEPIVRQREALACMAPVEIDDGEVVEPDEEAEAVVYGTPVQVAECLKVTANGRMKYEFCVSTPDAGIALDGGMDPYIACLLDLPSVCNVTPPPPRCAECTALFSDAVICTDHDFTVVYEYRDEQCTLQKRKHRTKQKQCFRTSDSQNVSHPTGGTCREWGGTVSNEVHGSTDCARCADAGCGASGGPITP